MVWGSKEGGSGVAAEFRPGGFFSFCGVPGDN